MKANVYVDGFNLYYGIKGTAYKWLDISKPCHLMLPQHDINRFRYFTARVKARPQDPQQPQRQQTFLRALQTIPNLLSTMDISCRILPECPSPLHPRKAL